MATIVSPNGQGRSDVHGHCHRHWQGRVGEAASGGRAAAHRDRLRSGDHRHRRVDLLRGRLPDRDRPAEDGSNARWFEVEAWEEALRLTTASGWNAGTSINLERALKIGDELGGHIVSGHVDGKAKIVAREDEGDAVRFTLEAPRELAKFIAPKGSVALDGTSLTVNRVEGTRFDVLLIHHSLTVTTWGERQAGDEVNLEVDTMARYAARLAEAAKEGL